MGEETTPGPDKASFGLRLRAVKERFRANARRIAAIVRGRRERALRTHDPLPAGQRPQDVLAILMLTVGIALVIADIPTYPWLQTLPHATRAPFVVLTDLGKAHWILWSTGLFCLACLAFADIDRLTWRVRMGLSMAWTYAAFVFFSVASTGILAILFKWTLGRARPKLYETVGPVEFDLFAFHGSYTSFPSGHSTTVAALATALALIFPSWRWLIIVAAFWIAFSRIMVGAHYPSDVIAGTLLGATVTLFCARWMARRRLGFRLSANGSVEPVMSRRSAAACARAIWHAALGRRGARRAPSSGAGHHRESE
ncbi:PAP2 superfamily protein [Polymorphum gilvum SL003B-26A1]|uniref:PAP2 superfamily protein n=2 Tax=Polymorphum TaxID=991903 RepID=F2IXA8_POLGS|nr:PAP2 superfamily protein [Polymorphum gilvum SL003B-26A1]